MVKEMIKGGGKPNQIQAEKKICREVIKTLSRAIRSNIMIHPFTKVR